MKSLFKQIETFFASHKMEVEPRLKKLNRLKIKVAKNKNYIKLNQVKKLINKTT